MIIGVMRRNERNLFIHFSPGAEDSQPDSAALGHPGRPGHPEENGFLRGHVQHLQPPAPRESQAHGR